jgi:hypothetical protein
MAEASVMASEPQSSPASWWRAADAPQPVGTFSDRFSPGVSLLAAVFLLSSLTSMVWLSASVAKLDRIEAPEQALTRMVGRTLDVQLGQDRAPAWQGALLGWITGDNHRERTQAIEWYRELAKISEEPVVPLQLAVLQAESGQIVEALSASEQWRMQSDPFPREAELLQAAYADGTEVDQETLLRLQADAAELLPAGWFYERLAERLASKADNQSLLLSIRRQAEARSDRLFSNSWKLTVAELCAMLIGSLVLLQIWRTRGTNPDLIRLHAVGVPPPWPGGVGAAVLLRGGAIGALITAIMLLYLPPENASLRALAIPLTNVPLLFLAYRHLFRPSGLTFEDGFGLDIPWSKVGRLGAAIMAAVAAGLWGEWAMDRATDYWHLGSHWTEWFDADLVWGAPSLTLVSLIEYVIFAPLFEEMAFRGLLFAILRRKFRFLPAALISAAIFGVAHGYGIVGLISVCWSGVLWAWIYEKSGSLVPGIFAHAINNLLVCLAVMALLR